MPSRAHNGRILDSAGAHRNLLLHMGISADHDHRCDTAMNFGGRIITFISHTDTGTVGALGTFAQAEVSTDVSGCHHRPLTFAETAEFDVDVATEMWKSTCPPAAAVLAAKANDTIKVDGVEYRIVGGVKHHRDMSGNPFKVTVISKKHIG